MPQRSSKAETGATGRQGLAPIRRASQRRQLFPHRFGRGCTVIEEKPLPGVREPIVKHFGGPTASNDEKTVELRRVHRPQDIPGDVLCKFGAQASGLSEMFD